MKQTTFTQKVQYDSETGDYYIPLPDALFDDLGWKIGDDLNWHDNGDGSFVISKRTPQCSTHPKAPHGFDRTASHSADRYVCECENWDPYQAGYEDGHAAAMDQYVYIDDEAPEADMIAEAEMAERRAQTFGAEQWANRNKTGRGKK